jgi:hypothetical protein
MIVKFVQDRADWNWLETGPHIVFAFTCGRASQLCPCNLAPHRQSTTLHPWKPSQKVWHWQNAELTWIISFCYHRCQIIDHRHSPFPLIKLFFLTHLSLYCKQPKANAAHSNYLPYPLLLVSSARIVGCTTSGLAKMQHLISAIRPRIVVVEVSTAMTAVTSIFCCQWRRKNKGSYLHWKSNHKGESNCINMDEMLLVKTGCGMTQIRGTSFRPGGL